MNLGLIGLGAFVIAMGVAWLATPVAVRLASVLGAVDQPDARKLHAQPVPRIGGIAVFAGFVTGMIFAAAVTGNLWTVPQPGVYWRGFMLATAGLFLVGLVDDLKPLSFKVKFAAQIAAAVFIWNSGFAVDVLTNPFGGDPIQLGWLSLPITVLWVVGITNAVNLIDGLDGLATGTAIIMTAAVAAIAFKQGDLGTSATSFVLVGSLIGFLWFNFNPARIFLGDSGSLFVGFILAVTSVRGSQKSTAVVAIFVPLLLVGLPLLDTTFAVLRRSFWLSYRSLRAESPLRYLAGNLSHVFLPDRKHIHHRLLEFGMSHRRAVLTLYLVAMLMVAAALALAVWNSPAVAGTLLAVLGALVAAFVGMILWRNRKEAAHQAPPPTNAAAVSPRK